ncbi:MAG: hypothetical protein COB02_02630 [Candidatus Cloacimonadota bacterium]|nr:MAG: hypothetical protein COB02_02630 [Candidatus Cloacimonadota bacterium]
MSDHHNYLIKQKVETGLIKKKPIMDKKNLIVASTCSVGSLATFLYFYSTPLFYPLLFTFLACSTFLTLTVIKGNKKPKINNVIIQRIKIVIQTFEQYPKMNFDQIKSAIDMNESTLLTTIKHMIESQILTEELDLDTNIWSYTISSDYLLEMDQAQITMDINSRIG